MLMIRLQRVGKKGQPSYRLVVSERRSKLGATPTEDLGAYDVMKKQAHFKKERVEHWLHVGAKPSVTVHNLFVREGIVSGAKLPVRMKAKKASEEAAANAAPAGEAAASAAAPAASGEPAGEANQAA